MLRTAYILLAATLMLTIASCERRNCDNVVCGGNQLCNSGNCFCADGYEGTNCETQSYLKYLGNYNGTENCYNSSPNFYNYPININQGYYVNQVELTNLFNLGIVASMTIHTDQSNQGNYVEVPYQSQGAVSFSGQGTFDAYNNRLTIDFNYTFNGQSNQCTHTFYKQ